MGIVISVVVVVVVAVGVGAAVMQRKRASDAAPAPTPAPPPTSRTPRPEPAPMTGLEEALNKATDRTGHTMADRLDAEADHVAQLRDTDDTGPLLRRALDSVDRGQEAPTAAATSSTDPSAPAGTPASDEPDPEQT